MPSLYDDEVSIIKKFEENLLNAWSQKGFDLGLFPDLSAELLKETHFPDPMLLLQESLFDMPFRSQNHSRGVFADLPFTLVKNEHFSIDLFVWLHAHTSIHDHPFVGAFKILHGSSRHLEYDFNHLEELESWLLKGELVVRNDEMIQKDHVQKVTLGHSYIHQVLHLDRPSVTLIVKSNRVRDFFDYIYPKYAWVDVRPHEDAYKKMSLVSSYFQFHYDSDSKNCQLLLEKTFEQLSAKDLFLMSYNYKPLYPSSKFEEALERLFSQDLKRFHWYNDVCQERVKHLNYINEMSSLMRKVP